MARDCTRSLTPFAATATALFLVGFAAPFLAWAQSSSASDVIQLITGEGKVTLQTSEDSSCSATSTNHAVAVAVGSHCSSFGTSADLPASLYIKIAADKITFRNAGKSYVIRDASVVASAHGLFAPVRDMMQRQSELGHKMSDLGTSESASARAYASAKVAVPDMTADFQRVEADAKRLSTEGGTQSELSELQSELSELQGRISEAQAEASEAARMSEEGSASSEQMRAMDEEMKAMSQQMSVWSRQGEDAAVQAARQVKALLDQAIASGAAKPE